MNTKHKQAKRSQAFQTERHDIYGGQAQLIKTKQSGDYWQFRMWIQEERKYVRKSLKTTHLDTAVERAEREFFDVKANVQAGRKIFSPTVQQVVEDYVQYRMDVDVKRQAITEGRLRTIRTQLKHFIAYCGIAGRDGHSSVTRLSDLEAKSLQGYQQYRLANGAKDVTIRNEQATINALCRWAYENGLHNISSYVFPTITRRGIDADSLRRSTYTDEEYGRITRALISYTSKQTVKQEKLDEDEIFARHLLRNFFFIGANTMMRFGEQYQMKWRDVETYSVGNQRLVTLNIRAETSKVRQSRVIKVRGGKYFDRLRALSMHTNANDYVFTAHSGELISRDALYARYRVIMRMAGITDYAERKLTFYSLRHYGITKRLQSEANPLTLSKVCGTSLKHLTETYYHADLSEQERAALQQYNSSTKEVIALD